MQIYQGWVWTNIFSPVKYNLKPGNYNKFVL